MACNHERIKSVNCKLFCLDCGAELPPKPLVAEKVDKNTTTAEKAPEAPKTPVKRTRKKT